MHRAINAPSLGNNVVDGINATNKRQLKEQMELIGELESNKSSKIEIISSASKGVSIRFADQCMHTLNNEERFNGLKGIT